MKNKHIPLLSMLLAAGFSQSADASFTLRYFIESTGFTSGQNRPPWLFWESAWQVWGSSPSQTELKA